MALLQLTGIAVRLVTSALQLSLEFLNGRFSPALRKAPELSPIFTPPDLSLIWLRLHETYFPTHTGLREFTVVWSTRRHRNTLASCSVDTKRILVAGAMAELRARPFLEPLLYHEMCHAVLGKPEKVNGRRVIHGAAFKQLEQQHPGIADLDMWILSGGWHATVRGYNRKTGKRAPQRRRRRSRRQQRMSVQLMRKL